VVIFDDVGKEKITDWVQVQYYRIINQRYALTRDRQVYVQAEDYRLAGR